MALQSSGSISLANLQTEYGGSNPISMSEYYRNGGLVPDSISSTAPGSYTAYFYNQTNTHWRVFVFSMIMWGGSAVSTGTLSSTATTFTSGGYDYQRGNFVGYVTTGSGKMTATSAHYKIRRRLSSVTTTTSVNQSVPTSSTISLSQFYGGRAS